MNAQCQSAARRKRSAQRSLTIKQDAPKKHDAPIQAADLSFGHWVSSVEDDDDTASSSSAGSKAANCLPQLADELLMCDEDIGECTQPSPKRRKSSDDFTSKFSPSSKQLSLLLSQPMQVVDAWFQLCMPHPMHGEQMLPTTVQPMQLRMHA